MGENAKRRKNRDTQYNSWKPEKKVQKTLDNWDEEEEEEDN